MPVVAASVFLFLHERPYLFVWISMAVLATLLASVFVAAPFFSTWRTAVAIETKNRIISSFTYLWKR